MDNYYIGVDAGGTKTTASAFSLTGELLQTSTSSFGNLNVDFKQGIANIKSAVDEITAKLGVPSMVVLGVAGVETGNNKEKAYAALKDSYTNLFITNDAMLALYSALKGKDGILIIAGTGSIGYLKKGDELKRFGGWGHLINDDGSGYTIAIKAIRYIAYSFDNNCSDTMLKRAIFEHLKITELKQLIDFTYKSTKGEIASLVPVIAKTASEGDPQASAIFKWAGERLAFLAVGLCHQYNVPNPKIAISGSVIKKLSAVKQSFCNTLNSELDGYTIIDNDFDPTKGVYYIAREQL